MPVSISCRDCLDHIETVLHNSCVRYRKSIDNSFELIHAPEPERYLLDRFCPDVIIRGDAALP
jgi:hypothetical protein